MQNGLENVFFTVCLVAFPCVGATHFSIRIFANTLWRINLGVCGGFVCCAGGHFCIASPMEFASFVGKLKLLEFSMLGGCPLLAFEGFPQ